MRCCSGGQWVLFMVAAIHSRVRCACPLPIYRLLLKIWFRGRHNTYISYLCVTLVRYSVLKLANSDAVISCDDGQTECATWHLSRSRGRSGSRAIEIQCSFFPESSDDNGMHQVVADLVTVVLSRIQ